MLQWSFGDYMLLKEFFGAGQTVQATDTNKEEKDYAKDELFWYIVNHDRLYKDYILPTSKKLKKLSEQDTDIEEMISMLQPAVDKGCKEFYAHKKLTGKLGKLFPKELRDGMCEELYHYITDQDKHPKAQQ